MNARTRIILAAGVTLFAAAAPKASDHRELQGRWRVVTVRQEAIFESLAVDGFVWTFAGDAITMTRDGKVEATGTFRLRPTATPKEIDFRFSSLKGKAGQTNLGIYLLEENRLTICTYKNGKVRPRHFPTAGDFSPDKIVFRRDFEPGHKPTPEEELVADLEAAGCQVDLDERSPRKPVIAIDADNTLFDDDCLEAIKTFSRLRDLNLHGAPVTDAGLVHLRALPKLKNLSLAFTEITDTGLAHLKGLSALQTLSLGNTHGITDAGLEQLKRLTNLRDLNVDGTKVTAEGVEALQKALPKVKISW